MRGRLLAPIPWGGFLGGRWRSLCATASTRSPLFKPVTISHTMSNPLSSISRTIHYCKQSRVDAVLPVHFRIWRS